MMGNNLRINLKQTKYREANSTLLNQEGGRKLCICRKSGRVYVITLYSSYDIKQNLITCAHIDSLKRVCP
jgi:hypothetical protein